MAASLPGATEIENSFNPSAGPLVILDLLSGPKGSPLDRGAGTGALSTGIGFGATNIAPCASTDGDTAEAKRLRAISDAGFTDDYVPGVTANVGGAASSVMLYIGGGRSDANGRSVPYTTGYGIGAAGNGAPRDAGAGPTTYTGFTTRTVTAAGAVANGAVVETGFVNRTGAALDAGESTFGVSTTATATPT